MIALSVRTRHTVVTVLDVTCSHGPVDILTIILLYFLEGLNIVQ